MSQALPIIVFLQGASDSISIHSNNCLLCCQDKCSELKCCRFDQNHKKRDPSELNCPSVVVSAVDEKDDWTTGYRYVRKRTFSDSAAIKKSITMDVSREKSWTEVESGNSAENRSPLLITQERLRHIGEKLSNSMKHLAHAGSSELKAEEQPLMKEP